MSEKSKQGINVCISLHPDSDERVFRLEAADDIARILVDAHDSEFTIRDLVNETGYSRSTVWRAVDFLANIGIAHVRETPQRNYVKIDPEHLQKDDPILAIAQSEYREPIRAFIRRVRSTLADEPAVDDLLGILVFGSVARGEADRKSDIDIFVIIDGDRTTARRRISQVAANLEEQPFDGDRYTFEPFVETPESATRAGEKLYEIFRGGITVYGTERFHEVRKKVMASER
ncbi:nucleotidyltransferase domain-containing protein [Halarchaeum nitratireducens]|uniref:Polymerase nucleotidyl transferase domain-containing protein n=1 Tax=Halarchaeum nitratireducens TaxID=489913 RepID=A0A830GF61_9EURY|nr:nucleotidyltransferase domain-containing protein [Halarchaeum nitratireducens]GGN22077.1 hypothetical protein GCM10009021_24390 [Halarchaeum nitratireducens]